MAKIMTVDDSNLMVSVISNFIKKISKDHNVISAYSGKEAIEKYKAEKPDLVFMDIKMPGIDGIEALQEIRKIDSNAKVVMCTALGEKAQEDKARALGAVGYLIKPFSSKDILDAVEKNT